MSFKRSEFRVLASGLEYPEGPVYRSDGGVLVVEIHKGTLTRVAPDGTATTVATLGGGPNGAAVGPDGAIYVCNNGGMNWIELPATPETLPLWIPTTQPADYVTGSIQRVTGSTFTTLYSQCNGNRLCSPDDLVFDAKGGFWFTDWGKQRATDRDITAVYYAQADGSKIVQAIPPPGYPLNLSATEYPSRSPRPRKFSIWCATTCAWWKRKLRHGRATRSSRWLKFQVTYCRAAASGCVPRCCCSLPPRPDIAAAARFAWPRGSR